MAKKNVDSYEKVEVKLENVPIHALIFLNKECWKVLKKEESSVKVWRLQQTGTCEVVDLNNKTLVRVYKSVIL